MQSFQTTTTIGGCNTKCSFTKSLSRSMNVHTTILTHLLGRIFSCVCMPWTYIHTYTHIHTHTYEFELYYTKTTAALTWCTRTQLTNPLNKTSHTLLSYTLVYCHTEFQYPWHRYVWREKESFLTTYIKKSGLGH